MTDDKNINTKNKSTDIHSVIKIGNTTYRLTSKFEGHKTIDEILKNLAIRKADRHTE